MGSKGPMGNQYSIVIGENLAMEALRFYYAKPRFMRGLFYAAGSGSGGEGDVGWGPLAD